MALSTACCCRSLGPGHEYAALLDEFTFTSCISNCVSQQDLSRALGLVEVRCHSLFVYVCGREKVFVLYAAIFIPCIF